MNLFTKIQIIVAVLATFAMASKKDYAVLFKYDAFNLCKYSEEAKSYLTKCTGKRAVENEVGYNFLGMIEYTPVDSSFIFVEGSAEWKSKMTSWRMDTNKSGEIISVVDFVYFDVTESAPVETKLVFAEYYTNVIRLGKSAYYFSGRLDYVTDTHKKPSKSNGSAVAISDSILITNLHVVSNLTKASLWLDGKRIDTDLGFDIISEQSDSALDVAIVKVLNGGLHACAISDTTPILGETVYVWGYPNTKYQGIDVKVTRGIVSGKNGFLGDDKMFQMDAAIQPGNSGGPVVQNGKIIGLATSYLIGGDNVAFAIKSEKIRGLLDLYNVKTKPTTDKFDECTYMILGTSVQNGESFK